MTKEKTLVKIRRRGFWEENEEKYYKDCGGIDVKTIPYEEMAQKVGLKPEEVFPRPIFYAFVRADSLIEFFEEVLRQYGKDKVVEVVLTVEKLGKGIVRVGLISIKCARQVESLCG